VPNVIEVIARMRPVISTEANEERGRETEKSQEDEFPRYATNDEILYQSDFQGEQSCA
jgi:hypothetical protein